MKMQELRIGNWVNNGFGKPFQIFGIISEGNTGGYKLSTLNPIPITPEILEKCGFEKNEHHGTFDNLIGKEGGSSNGLFITLDLDDPTHSCSIGQLTHFSHNFGEYKSLHQLQNLYFALTGKELEIKL